MIDVSFFFSPTSMLYLVLHQKVKLFFTIKDKKNVKVESKTNIISKKHVYKGE